MQPDMFETPFEALLREKEVLEAANQKALADLGAFYGKLEKGCTHDVKKLMHQYYPGDYNDRSRTDTWYECVLCRKQFNRQSSSGGSYG